MERAREAGGRLIYRDEDIDPDRCKPEFAAAALEDLHWFGCNWDEGPDVGGSVAPYRQSERMPRFLDAWKHLKEAGFIYPCDQSRKDVRWATQAPHADEEGGESIYPEHLRPPIGTGKAAKAPGDTNWRFRVPSDRTIKFDDRSLGPCAFDCLRDFGDFHRLAQGRAQPAYELAVVVDDAAMAITEVVRGQDLLISTARQLLVYEALGLRPPEFLPRPPALRLASGQRLAKRTPLPQPARATRSRANPCKH